MKQDYLIAVDLDGTLLTHTLEVDMKSIELLRVLKDTNKVVIATGRPFRSSLEYYNLIGLDTPIINYNGALVHNPVRDNFKKQKITISKNVVIDLIGDMNEYIINLFCEIEDDVFLLNKTDEALAFIDLYGANLIVGHPKDTLRSDPNGAMVFLKLGAKEKLESYINEKYQGKIKIRFWFGPNYEIVEIYSTKTSKAHGLEVVSNHYGISQDKIIAIGDGHNDIEMISYASYGVVMGNAHPELEKIAKYRTKSVEESGVYSFLKGFFK